MAGSFPRANTGESLLRTERYGSCYNGRVPGVDADALAALAPVLRRLEVVLYRFALRATRDPELSHDLTQEALLAVIAERNTFGGRSSLRTWAIGILSHKVMDHFRRRATRPTEGLDERELLTSPSAEDVERVVAAREQLAAVERSLKRLPDLERLALLLVDVEGLDREDCCRALGVTATHLRVLIHRGRNHLRRMLEHDR
jgi:RNA polymerase sigma-70 factor (ECF subfamily)